MKNKLIAVKNNIEIAVKFDIQVDENPVFTREDGSILRLPGVEIRKETGEHLSFASERYGILTHKNFLAKVERALSERGFSDFALRSQIDKREWFDRPNVEYFTSKDGSRMKARYYIPVPREIRTGDRVSAFLQAGNSMNQSSSESLEMGMIREICSNGMVGFSNQLKLAKQHSKKCFDAANPEFCNSEFVLTDQLATLWDHYESDIDICRNLDSVAITLEEANKLIDLLPIGNLNAKRKRAENHFDEIRRRLLNSQFDGERAVNRLTAFDLLNATTEHLTHSVEQNKARIETADRLRGQVAPLFRRLNKEPLDNILADWIAPENVEGNFEVVTAN